MGFSVKSWLGCVEVDFIRLWVGHSETPWYGRDHYILGDEFATLLLGYLRHSY
jgi:hypothetical protein